MSNNLDSLKYIQRRRESSGFFVSNLKFLFVIVFILVFFFIQLIIIYAIYQVFFIGNIQTETCQIISSVNVTISEENKLDFDIYHQEQIYEIRDYILTNKQLHHFITHKSNTTNTVPVYFAYFFMDIEMRANMTTKQEIICYQSDQFYFEETENYQSMIIILFIMVSIDLLSIFMIYCTDLMPEFKRKWKRSNKVKIERINL